MLLAFNRFISPFHAYLIFISRCVTIGYLSYTSVSQLDAEAIMLLEAMPDVTAFVFKSVHDFLWTPVAPVRIEVYTRCNVVVAVAACMIITLFSTKELSRDNQKIWWVLIIHASLCATSKGLWFLYRELEGKTLHQIPVKLKWQIMFCAWLSLSFRSAVNVWLGTQDIVDPASECGEESAEHSDEVIPEPVKDETFEHSHSVAKQPAVTSSETHAPEHRGGTSHHRGRESNGQ